MSTVIVVGCSMVGSGTRFRPTVPSIRHWEDVYDTSMHYIHVLIHRLYSKVSTILTPILMGEMRNKASGDSSSLYHAPRLKFLL